MSAKLFPPMTPIFAEPAEAELRALRDAIYGPGTDNNWESCKDAWRRDAEWLKNNLRPSVKSAGKTS